jgi:rRNA maturation endonuclease Nob1
MKICYPCADVFTPDSYERCPRCGQEMQAADQPRWRSWWKRMTRRATLAE